MKIINHLKEINPVKIIFVTAVIIAILLNIIDIFIVDIPFVYGSFDGILTAVVCLIMCSMW